MTDKILITGGCGFVGANLIRKLLGNGHEVTVLDNLSRGNPDYLNGLDVTIVEADIRDIDASKKAFEGIDKVVHLAAFGSVVESVDDPIANFDINVKGTLNILALAKQYNVSKLVFSSTGGALIGNAKPPVNESSLPKPISPYGAGKLCCEAYCNAYSQSYGLNTICLRFANVYGPFSQHKQGVINKFVDNIINNKPLIIYGDGSSTRDYIHVSDLCNGITLALENNNVQNEVLHIASGKETSLKELADMFLKIAGKPNHPVNYKDSRVGEVEKNFALYERAATLLGYKPSIDIESGLGDAWDWLKQYY